MIEEEKIAEEEADCEEWQKWRLNTVTTSSAMTA